MRARASAWRRLAAWLHLWGGLVTGPLILVLALSGGVLIFRPELDDLAAGRAAVVSRGTAAPLDRIVGAALVHYPGAELRALHVPERPDRPYRVALVADRVRLDLAVDPYTAQVVGGRAGQRSVLAAVHSLHAALHAGAAGVVLVGVLGLGLVVVSLAGLWLYWPPVWRRRPASPVRRPAAALSRTLHRVVGLVSLAFGVVIGLTGALLALSGFAGPRAPDPPAQGSRPVRLEAIARSADAALPGGRISAIVVDGPAAVRVDKRLGDGRAGTVHVEPGSGRILAVRAEASRFGGWSLVRRLHYGDFGGWPLRLVWALVGLALPVLAITGYLISARRAAYTRRARPAQ